MNKSFEKLAYCILYIILFFLFTIQGFFYKLNAKNTSESWIKDFNDLSDEIIQYYRPPGVAIAIVTPHKLLALKTCGVRQVGLKNKIDEGTVFRIASLSKLCTSALVVKLSSRGLIDIGVPLTAYLPNINIAGRLHTHKIKVKDLLSHSSGIKRYSLEKEAYSRKDFNEIVKEFQSVRIIGEPGESYQYQNLLFSLIDPVVENATKRSFIHNLKKEILYPLGITNCAISEKEYALCKNLAIPHVGRKSPNYTVCREASYYYNLLPAAGMSFNIKDMATLLQAFMGGFPDVLDDKTLEKLYFPRVLVGKGNRNCNKYDCFCKNNIVEYYGLGCRIKHDNGNSIIYHGGAVKGFTSVIAFSNEYKIGIVVLTNANLNPLPKLLSTCFFKMLFHENHKRPERLLSNWKRRHK